jgi:hypothetical protein
MMFAAILALAASVSPVSPVSVVQQFQTIEQSLMDAITAGDRVPWERVMDADCVLTTEEGEVLTREAFLKDLRPLPAGLSGAIAVRDLTVQERSDVAVVRFLADESETVFGQRLTTRYRVTDTFRRSGAAWKMIASHVSVVTTDPPPQRVATDGWSGLAGTYQLEPDGWTLHVELQNGVLYGGRDRAKLRPFIPLTPTSFVLQGSLGEWLFVVEHDGKASRIVDFRKFEPLVWTRIE